MNFKIVPNFPVLISSSTGSMVFKDNGKERFKKFCLSNHGEFILELRKPVRRRSLKQNAALWAIPVTIIYENTYGQWDNKDDVYHFLEDKFAPRKMVQVGKEVRTIPKKLKELNSTEFGEVYLKIQAWGAQELALEIPSPDKEYRAHELLKEINEEV